MSQVVQAYIGTVRTGILEGLACGTCWDVPSSPSCSRTAILEGLASGTSWDVLSCPEAIFGTG